MFSFHKLSYSLFCPFPRDHPTFSANILSFLLFKKYVGNSTSTSFHHSYPDGCDSTVFLWNASFPRLFSFCCRCMLFGSGGEKLLSTARLVDSLGLSAESDKALRRAFTFSRNSRLFLLSSCKCVGSLTWTSFSHSYLPCDWGNSKQTFLDFLPLVGCALKKLFSQIVGHVSVRW